MGKIFSVAEILFPSDVDERRHQREGLVPVRELPDGRTVMAEQYTGRLLTPKLKLAQKRYKLRTM